MDRLKLSEANEFSPVIQVFHSSVKHQLAHNYTQSLNLKTYLSEEGMTLESECSIVYGLTSAAVKR
jgi:hypothetical protein